MNETHSLGTVVLGVASKCKMLWQRAWFDGRVLSRMLLVRVPSTLGSGGEQVKIESGSWILDSTQVT